MHGAAACDHKDVIYFMLHQLLGNVVGDSDH
jgi:hypothetical protein